MLCHDYVSTVFDLFKIFMQFDLRMSKAVGFVQKLMDASNNSERCPYLAHLQIEKRKLLFGKCDAEKLAEHLMQYFIRYIIT